MSRKVVLAPIGSRGDVQPMLALGCGLAERGHDVTIAAPENFEGWVRPHGLAFAPVGTDMEADLRRYGDRVQTTRHQMRILRTEIVPQQFAAMPDICAGADLIVGAGLQAAGPSVAEYLGVPYAFVAYAPVVLRSVHHAPPVVRWQRLPRAANRLCWRGFARMLRLVLEGPVTRGRQRLGLAPVSDISSYLTAHPIVLAADVPLTGTVPDLAPNVHCVAALRLEDGSALPPAVVEFLDRGDPPVLVGFGSMYLSRMRELVGVFADAAARVGVRLLIQSGWTGVAARDVALPAHCLLTGALPHDQLLPRVRAVVHHGGAGTTTSAVRAGRPHLVVPLLLDQFYWAGRVRALGLGPEPMAVRRIGDSRALGAALGRLVSTEAYAQRAATLAGRITGNGVEEAIGLLEQM
ncbi:MAG: glycosyltransferase [Gemmatimonadota bacterium]|nr:glycosyltransferase [Gemmatimonadota bacterium]